MAPDCKWLVASPCRFSVALICAYLAAGWPLPLTLSSPPFYHPSTNPCRKLSSPYDCYSFESLLNSFSSAVFTAQSCYNALLGS